MSGSGISAGVGAGTGTFNTRFLHVAARASSQHGDSVPKAHDERMAEGNQTEAISSLMII